MSYQKEREEFIARFIAEGGTLADARAILRDAATVQRYAVTACNRELTRSEILRDEAAQARILRRAAFLLNSPARGVDFSGDPRGYVVKMHFASGAYNTCGGKEEGYGVPTRT